MVGKQQEAASEEQPKSGAAKALKALLEVRDWQAEAYGELHGVELRPAVDYSREGLEKFAEAVHQAGAWAERAGQLYAESTRRMGVARAAIRRIRAEYQERYDAVTVEKARKLADLSWEERASYYRMALLSQGASLRDAESVFELLQGYQDAIKELAWTIKSARQDLLAILQTVTVSARIGELERARSGESEWPPSS